MKVVCYSRPFYPLVGGLETIAHIVCSEMSKTHDVTLITETQSNGEDDTGFPYGVIRCLGPKKLWQEFRGADVVLFFGMSLRALPLGILSLRPIVLSHHGIYTTDHRKPGTMAHRLRLIPTMWYLNICVSRYVARYLPGRNVVIHNAYDESTFHVSEDETKEIDFMFCGRLVSEKGVGLLVHAMQRVVSNAPSATLYIVGDGPEYDHLNCLVRELGISEQVHFVGSMDSKSVAAMMRRARVLVVPSICQESFGIVALEGMASGCHVIATNNGGLPEALSGFGAVVEADGDALATAMLASLSSSPCQDKGQRELISRYLRGRSRSRVAKHYMRILSLAARKP